MNYYKQGDAANAERIKAAFEKLGYDVTGFDMCNDNILFFTYELEGGGKVISTTNANLYTANIIKTHPDYKELELPVEPKSKFKVGDWIAGIDDEGDVATEKIVCFMRNKVLLVDIDGCFTEYPKTELNNFHLWTIKDAKDGDVLVNQNGEMPFVFKSRKGNHIYCHCAYTNHKDIFFEKFLDDGRELHWINLLHEQVQPATKEQHDLLFAKMKEEGYEWDEKRKELRKTIKPTFKVGDWVVKKDGGTFYCGNYAEQVTLIEDDGYPKRIWLSSTTYVHDGDIRLWSMADAKDGDVLSSIRGCPFIYDKYRNQRNDLLYYYAGIDGHGDFVMKCPEKMPFHFGPSTDAVPAAKEQRDLLFAKMREAGYEWDEKKKELRKIKPHYDISNFHAGMPVLVRDDNDDEWNYLLFSHYRKKLSDRFFAGGSPWFQCIPFNDDTKHLLGTTDMCDEQYINW